MTTYVYYCDNCGNNKEISHSIHSNKKYRCNNCKHYMKKVLFPPHIVGEPTTVGGIADRNARVLQKSGIGGTINKGDKTDSVRTKTYREISKMTPEQQKKYILTGK